MIESHQKEFYPQLTHTNTLVEKDKMKMPLSEILDRYTITKLKSERTSEDVSDELQTYKSEVENPDYSEKSSEIASFVDRLYGFNGELWDTEKDIRKGVDMPLEKVGRLALKVRDLNRKRNEIKAEVVDTFSEGFKEIKINYKKVDYGRKEIK